VALGIVAVPAVSDSGAATSGTPPVTVEAPAPALRPPAILAAPMPPSPAPDKGRLVLMIGGNRRWCTFPDDRIVRPPEKPGTVQKRNEVYTFGYRFTVSAVKRGQADTPLMLFESPVFRTASWLPASKAGLSRKTGPRGPIVLPEGDRRLTKASEPPVAPETLVPRWQEESRCVTLPERMDFDLAPGTYDVYVAFDILNRENSWMHRSTGYLTDVPVETARRTRLDGLVNLGAGSERQVDIQLPSVSHAQPLTAPPLEIVINVYADGRMIVIETFERGCEPKHRPTPAPAPIRIDTS